MLVTAELRSRAWRSNVVSVRLRRSSHTAAGSPTSSTTTSRVNRSPRDSVITERKLSIVYPFGTALGAQASGTLGVQSRSVMESAMLMLHSGTAHLATFEAWIFEASQV